MPYSFIPGRPWWERGNWDNNNGWGQGFQNDGQWNQDQNNHQWNQQQDDRGPQGPERTTTAPPPTTTHVPGPPGI